MEGFKQNFEQFPENETKKENGDEKNMAIRAEEVGVFGKAEAVFNISRQELESVEGFSDLSGGQQALVMENLQQMTLGRVQEEAIQEHREKIGESGLLGKLWQSASKTYQIAKLEKKKAEEIQKGGIAAHGEVLKQLVKGMKEFGPEAHFGENGLLEINYISEKELGELNQWQKFVVERFNRLAAAFARLPEEYGFQTASKENREEFSLVKRNYEMAKRDVLAVIKEKTGSEKEAFFRLNKTEQAVKINQFLNTNPEAEKELEKIKSGKLWSKALLNLITEKGIYTGVGYLSRTAVTGALTAVGASLSASGPVAAGLAGGFVAWRRAKSELKEKEIAGRKGYEDKSRAAKNFVKAENLSEKLERTILSIKSAASETEKKTILDSLKVRIGYTRKKLNEGLVNFGAGKNSLDNKYDILRKLADAAAYLEMEEADKYSEKESRLNSFLDFKREKISTEQKKYLVKQTLKGAGIAVGFAFGGYLIRHFAGEWFGWDKKAQSLASEPEKLKQTKIIAEDFSSEEQKNLIQKYAKSRLSSLAEDKEDILKGVKAIPEDHSVAKEIKIAAASENLADMTKSKGVPAVPENYGAASAVKETISAAKETVAAVKTENLAAMLNPTNAKDSLSKILDYAVNDKNYKFSGGRHIIKDFYEKGFKLVVETGKDGKIRFGVDGPAALGRYNWGEEGKGWLFKATAELNKENLNKAIDFIKKANETFYKGPSDYTKEGWS